MGGVITKFTVNWPLEFVAPVLDDVPVEDVPVLDEVVPLAPVVPTVPDVDATVLLRVIVPEQSELTV